MLKEMYRGFDEKNKANLSIMKSPLRRQVHGNVNRFDHQSSRWISSFSPDHAHRITRELGPVEFQDILRAKQVIAMLDY
jgi:hypothetical protein